MLKKLFNAITKTFETTRHTKLDRDLLTVKITHSFRSPVGNKEVKEASKLALEKIIGRSPSVVLDMFIEKVNLAIETGERRNFATVLNLDDESVILSGSASIGNIENIYAMARDVDYMETIQTLYTNIANRPEMAKLEHNITTILTVELCVVLPEPTQEKELNIDAIVNVFPAFPFTGGENLTKSESLQVFIIHPEMLTKKQFESLSQVIPEI